MAGNTTGAKGNPASKRMGNNALKARRAASWSRGQKRKLARKKAQTEREVLNASLRADGELTPWERVKAKRRERRALDPEVQKRAAKYAA